MVNIFNILAPAKEKKRYFLYIKREGVLPTFIKKRNSIYH